jgi:hypothetical protein
VGGVRSAHKKVKEFLQKFGRKILRKANIVDLSVNGSAIDVIKITIRVMVYEVTDWIRLAPGRT